ncbi:hypothetical protein GFY24_18025 [Nocardia sp. SYP-A9097]|uniref:hypothetical protein n=1 Tax=Nocardia sp. SYP-A9097 TaxID=2663237 RepID=UPI00129B575B|nr:hypothetical protein [Nocardia sp. SYP-A9097]MRH89323.1 hypothetical protein [Nocardia sp. SYP-A9097]
MLDVADLNLGSGVRPGEAAAAVWDQFDLAATPAMFTVSATVVRLAGKGGLFRQEWAKTEAGRGGVLCDPHNFNRTWRDARGTLYHDVTQYTFLKTVATLISEASDSKTAARQLGSSREGITERHYMASPAQAPDSSAVLQRDSAGPADTVGR